MYILRYAGIRPGIQTAVDKRVPTSYRDTVTRAKTCTRAAKKSGRRKNNAYNTGQQRVYTGLNIR
jgi:hypothetical protein